MRQIRTFRLLPFLLLAVLASVGFWVQIERQDASAAGPTAPQACTALDNPGGIPAPSLIDFDDLSEGQVISTTYKTAYGVTFVDSRVSRVIAYGGDPGSAQSPPNVARNEALPPTPNDAVPLEIYFDTAQTYVGFWIGNGQGTAPSATLRAYDADAAEICSIDVGPVPDDHLTLFAGLHDSSGSIVHVSLEYVESGVEESIDDLYFTDQSGPPTATPTSTPTPTPTQTPTPITPLPTVTSTPTKTATPQPPTDLIIDGMEFTQAIQDLNNSVPLVAGKRTFVRVYARSTVGSHATFATLKLQAGGLSTTLYPIAPGGPFVNIRPSYLRLIGSHAFLFEIPTYWTVFFNQVTVTAEVNPALIWRPHSPLETSYANNLLTQTVNFESVPTMHLMIGSQPYKIGNITYTPGFNDLFGLYGWLKRVYPVSQIKLYLRTLPELEAVREWVPTDNAYRLLYPTCSFLNSYMAYARVSLIGHPFFPTNTGFYAMVDDGGGFLRGCAPIGGKWIIGGDRVRVASGPTGAGTWGWDDDGTYGDWYGGHELGHAYTQFHVRGGPGMVEDGCGGEAKSVKHNPAGYISPLVDLFDPDVILGFDSRRLVTGKNPILAPVWHDVMTYCDYQWIDQTTNLLLLLRLNGILPLETDSAPNGSPAQDLLTVFGVLDVLRGEVQLLPGFVVQQAPQPNPSGDHAVVLRDAMGGELVRHPFTLIENEPGPAPSEEPNPPQRYLAEMVPYHSAATQLEIEGPGGVVLHTVQAGAAPPAVQVSTPNGGEILAGDTLTVTWTASDPDGDPLAFNVEYSADDGLNWEPVALGLTGTQTIVSSFNLVTSVQARIRVTASDGLHVSDDTSDGTFTVPNHDPLVEITGPASGMTLAVSQTLSLEANAYDLDLGSLEAGQLSWSSSLDGPLGDGDQLSLADLSVGLHVITLTANDGQGGVATDVVTVTVVATPLDLPVPSDGLAVGPDLVLLDPFLGLSTIDLFVENQNPGSVISWQASVDQTWLTISATSGATPAALSLSVDPVGLPPGKYYGALRFTSAEVPGAPVVVPVYFVVPHFELGLPVIPR